MPWNNFVILLVFAQTSFLWNKSGSLGGVSLYVAVEIVRMNNAFISIKAVQMERLSPLLPTKYTLPGRVSKGFSYKESAWML